MQLDQQTINGYLQLLASDAPAPGGGSASALCGAQGAALLAMVAGLTVGRPKYAEYEQAAQAAMKEGNRLVAALTEAIDRDTKAFMLVSDAFKLPKETDEQKAARKKAIADGTLVATQVPFDTTKLALEGLRAVKGLVGKSNPNAASDLGVAALNLLSCAKGAWLNVLINLGGVKDEQKAAAFRQEGQAMVAEAEQLAGEIYTAVAESL